MKKYSNVFRYLATRWKLGLMYALFNILGVVFSFVSLAMLVPFLNFLFDDSNAQNLVYPKPVFNLSFDYFKHYLEYWLSFFIQEHGRMGGLLLIIIVLFLSVLFKNLFLYLASYVLIPLRNSIVRDIRKDLYSKILKLPLGFFTNERKGDLLTRMTSDIQEVEISLISALQLLFKEPFTIIFYLSLMFVWSVKMTLFLIFFLSIAGYFIGIISKKLKAQSTEGQEKQSEMMSLLDETFSGLRIIKSFTSESLLRLKFSIINNNIYRVNNKLFRRRDLASPMSEFLGVAVLCVILWVGGSMIINHEGGMNGKTFILFILAFTQLITPLKSLSSIFYNLHKGSASLDRIEKILLAPNKIEEIAKPINKKTFENSIQFKNISFAFAEKNILQNINLEIEKGKTIALVGASGAGKSSLVDLLSRFHDVSKGEILIDGENIKNMSLYSLRNLIGIVSQEAILFNDTIYNNINLSNKHTEGIKEKVIEAAKIAYAHDFIMSKEEGYEYNVGDRGNKLSGGEKQRITIARAILKDPPILVLDEATSALDTVSEKWVQDALSNLMKNRTTLVIAHRLSTVKHADEIIVLEKGQIIERGTHQELLNKKGQYFNLVEMQNLK